MVLFVQTANRGLRLGIAAHLDEAESLAAPGLAIFDHLGALDLAERRESASRSELFTL